MKNILISFIIISLISTETSIAQIRLGVRGGINASRLKTNDVIVTPNPTSDENYKITIPKHTMVGYHIGLIGQIQLFNFFIQPEALYTVTRNDINIYDLNSVNPDDADPVTQKLNRIEFPIIIGVKMNVFKVGLGPVFTFLISDDSDLKRITEYDLQLNKGTIGFQAGAGLQLKKLTFDVKYEGSLSKISDGINIGNNEKMSFDSRISQFILSAGIFF